MFLEKLRASLANCDVELHAYVLMANHFHLLVATPKENLFEFRRLLSATLRPSTDGDALPPRADKPGDDRKGVGRVGLHDGEPREEADPGKDAGGQEIGQTVEPNRRALTP